MDTHFPIRFIYGDFKGGITCVLASFLLFERGKDLSHVDVEYLRRSTASGYGAHNSATRD